MNKIKTTRGLLSAMVVAAALGLVACGGGDSAGSTESVLPKGVAFTPGDGVNLGEYNAITCGMPRDEVRRIIADAPTLADSEIVMMYSLSGGLNASFNFANGVLKQKGIGNGKAAGQVDDVRC